MGFKWTTLNTTSFYEIWQLMTLSFPPNKVWCEIMIRNEWQKWKHMTKSGINRSVVIKREVIAYIWHLATMRNFFAPKILNDLWNLDNGKKCKKIRVFIIGYIVLFAKQLFDMKVDNITSLYYVEIFIGFLEKYQIAKIQ